MSQPHRAAEAPINVGAALQRLDGNRELLAMLAEYFLEDGPAMLLRVQAAASKRDLPELRMAAHSLSGLAAPFEALPVVRMTQQIEALALQGYAGPYTDEVAQLEREFNRLQTAVAALRSP